MYFYAVRTVPKSGVDVEISPSALITYIDDTTEIVDENNQVDKLHRVSWAYSTIIEVLSYNPYTQIKHIDFKLTGSSATVTTFGAGFEAIDVSIQYEDSSYYDKQDWLASNTSTLLGEYNVYNCVRYVLL